MTRCQRCTAGCVTIADEQPYGEEFSADGVFVKQMVIPKAGTIVPQHSHTYDHLSVLAVGTVEVWRDGVRVGEYTAPAGIVIPAHTKHLFVSLTDGAQIMCVHNTARTGAIEVAQENNIFAGDMLMQHDVT